MQIFFAASVHIFTNMELLLTRNHTCLMTRNMATVSHGSRKKMPSPQLGQTRGEACYCRFHLIRWQHSLQLIDDEIARIDEECSSNDFHSKSMKVEMERCRAAIMEMMTREDVHTCRQKSSSDSIHDNCAMMQHSQPKNWRFTRINSMTNGQLTHELLLDPFFRMETEEEIMAASVEHRIAIVKSNIQDKAFWKTTCESLVFATRAGAETATCANHPR